MLVKTKEYIAFLRGINISGKNKINMSDLKSEFENMGYDYVSTYLNSGNVLFSSNNESALELKSEIEKMIVSKFSFDIPVYVISKVELQDILANVPEWWGTGDKNKYDNIIFIINDEKPEEICNMLGPVSEDLETMQIYKNIIFWTFDRKMYQNCNWWKKTASTGIAEKLTIRTANTVRKLCK